MALDIRKKQIPQLREMIEKLCNRIGQPLAKSKQKSDVGDWFLDFGYSVIAIYAKTTKEVHVSECQLVFVLSSSFIDMLEFADFILTEYNNNMQ